MDFLEAVDSYFRGERQVGYALIPIGIGLVAIGAYLFQGYSGTLGKSMGVPLAVAGIAAAIGGGFLVKTVNQRQDMLIAADERGDEQPRAAERARIIEVNHNWVTLKRTWSALMALAIVLILLTRRDWVTGIALALVCLCAMAMVVDTFAEKRARVYAERIGAGAS